MDADLKATAEDVRKQTDTLLMEIILPPNVINQVEEGNSDRCYGLVADNNYLLVVNMDVMVQSLKLLYIKSDHQLKRVGTQKSNISRLENH